MKRHSIRILNAIWQRHKAILAAALAMLAFFYHPHHQHNLLESIIESGELQVATRMGALSYFELDEVASGLDYDILQAFAVHLGVSLNITLFDEFQEQLDAVNQGAHISAASFTVTPERQEKYNFSASYLEVTSLLIQHSSKKSITDLSQVGDAEIHVIEDSSHERLLSELAKTFPNVNIKSDPAALGFEFIDQVNEKEIEYAVIDSSLFHIERSLFPRVEQALELDQGEPIAFVLQKTEDNSLLEALNEFINELRKNGQLDEMHQKYLSAHRRFDAADSIAFKNRINQRLPDFEDMFISATKDTEFDWTLIAAMAYQESHWNPNARSPTGVRGLMMLTRPTAKQLGVTDRLDPHQSLQGGIRYLQQMKKRIPDRILEPDRTKFALAAYNVGYGHLEDARILTERGGKNPDLWDDVAEHLPLLRKRKYFSTVKRGYARGNEPVIYVTNIFHYQNILQWFRWQRELDLKDIFDDERKQYRDHSEQPDFLDPGLAPL